MARCTTNLALLTALGMSKRAADGDCLSVARPFVKAKDLSVNYVHGRRHLAKSDDDRAKVIGRNKAVRELLTVRTSSLRKRSSPLWQISTPSAGPFSFESCRLAWASLWRATT